MSNTDNLLLSVWAYDARGNKVHPFKGLRGDKKNLYSVNFTNDTKNFQAMTEAQLIAAIQAGRFRDRGTVRMRGASQAGNNAFAPVMLGGRKVKDF